MEGAKILERIVEEEGNCCWARPSICINCPLGQLIRSDNGKFMSCVEALGVDGLSEEEADAKYKEAALSKLGDIELEKILEASDGS